MKKILSVAFSLMLLLNISGVAWAQTKGKAPAKAIETRKNNNVSSTGFFVSPVFVFTATYQETENLLDILDINYNVSIWDFNLGARLGHRWEEDGEVYFGLDTGGGYIHLSIDDNYYDIDIDRYEGLWNIKFYLGGQFYFAKVMGLGASLGYKGTVADGDGSSRFIINPYLSCNVKKVAVSCGPWFEIGKVINHTNLRGFGFSSFLTYRFDFERSNKR